MEMNTTAEKIATGAPRTTLAMAIDVERVAFALARADTAEWEL